jgi:slime mold repeat-containing protein
MTKPPASLRTLVLGIAICAAGRAGAVDITGTWAVCMHQSSDPFCPQTFQATIVGSGTSFTMNFPTLNCPDVPGTVDPGTGAMTAPSSNSNCLGGNGALDGTATDTSMSGNIYVNDGICAFQFDAVRTCPACDDGNGCTADGCGATACSAPSSTCTYADAPPGSSCSDGALCTTADHCDNTGTCVGTPVGCGDNNPCTTDFCDASTGACVFAPTSGPCNDGNACTTSDTCSGGFCVGGPPRVCQPCERCGPFVGCVVGPKAGCKLPVDPRKSQLVLRNNATDAGDRLAWKWTGDATTTAELGDPVTADDYTLCIFDQTATTPRLLLSSTAPAASTCPFGPAGEPCWKALGDPPGAKGFTYRNGGLFSPDGVSRLKIRPGVAGKAKASVKGQGSNLQMPSPLDVTPPVRVQLQAENGQCWEASYTSALQDREDVFRAKGEN